MRLLRVKFPDFHGSGELEISFAQQRQEDPALAFMIGPNGSGKSRLLEAVGHVFAHLAAGQAPGFGFEIEYEVGPNRVLLSSEQNGSDAVVAAAPRLPQVGVRLLVCEASSFEFWRSDHAHRAWPTYLDDVLPFRVVGISSGPASRLQWALRDSVGSTLSLRLAEEERTGAEQVEELDHDDEMAEEIIREKLRELVSQPRCLAIDGRELVLAVLALLSHGASRRRIDAARDEILDKARLDMRSLRSFSFEVAADWRKLLPMEDERMFVSFLEHAVRRVALAQVSMNPEERNQRAVYLQDASLEEWISQYAKTPLLWFTRLQTWVKAGVLHSPELLFGLRGRKGLVRHLDLSDGEFLYVGRYALLLLLREYEDCLILLDEPETHFNDRWKIDLVFDMQRILRGGRAQVVMATHSDLTLTDADRSDVFVFEEAEGDTDLTPTAPTISPLGADRSEITQQVFGASSASGRRAIEIVEGVLRRNDPAEIEDTLGRLGPGFQRFRLRYALERDKEQRDDP